MVGVVVHATNSLVAEDRLLLGDSLSKRWVLGSVGGRAEVCSALDETGTGTGWKTYCQP
jgi:hypothetical protein